MAVLASGLDCSACQYSRAPPPFFQPESDFQPNLLIFWSPPKQVGGLTQGIPCRAPGVHCGATWSSAAIAASTRIWGLGSGEHCWSAQRLAIRTFRFGEANKLGGSSVCFGYGFERGNKRTTAEKTHTHTHPVGTHRADAHFPMSFMANTTHLSSDYPPRLKCSQSRIGLQCAVPTYSVSGSTARLESRDLAA